jgi:hypothetical protein
MYGLDPILPGDIEDCSIEPIIKQRMSVFSADNFASLLKTSSHMTKLCQVSQARGSGDLKITEIRHAPISDWAARKLESHALAQNPS